MHYAGVSQNVLIGVKRLCPFHIHHTPNQGHQTAYSHIANRQSQLPVYICGALPGPEEICLYDIRIFVLFLNQKQHIRKCILPESLHVKDHPVYIQLRLRADHIRLR